ncbi:MAG: hypothetical protein ACRDV1_10830 [Actinomycetes bacterium]
MLLLRRTGRLLGIGGSVNALVRPSAVATAVLLGVGLMGAPAASAAAAPAPARLLVTVDHGRVHMPSSLRSARYRFVVKAVGRADGVQLVKPDRGYTKDEFRADARRSDSRNRQVAKRAVRHMLDNIRFFGGVNAERGDKAVFWETLYTGRYWVLTQTSQRIREVRVHGSVRRTAMPAFDGTLRVRDGKITAAPRVLPRHGKFLVRSTGTQPHQLVLMRLAPGKTAADVKKFLRRLFEGDLTVLDEEPPMDLYAEPLGTGVLSPGTQYVQRYTLPRGNYAVLCFMPDLRDLDSLKIHFVKGEVGEVRVR